MRRYLKLALLTSSLLQLQAYRTNSQASPVQDTSEITSNSASKSLNVPYYCQMDNRVEPSATCSNSSLAMILDYKGKKSLGYSGNLAEQLYSKFGKLNSIQKISRAARSLGYTAQTRVPSSFDQIKNDINQGHPVIVGGDFSGSAGHYVVVIGYNSKDFSFTILTDTGTKEPSVQTMDMATTCVTEAIPVRVKCIHTLQ